MTFWNPSTHQLTFFKRWRELGYRGFSAYVTALIRYDLLLLGPHHYFNAEDTAPALLASLDLATVRMFEANRPQRGYLDSLIESAAGRPLTPEENAQKMRDIVAWLREMATKPRAAGSPAAAMKVRESVQSTLAASSGASGKREADRED